MNPDVRFDFTGAVVLITGGGRGIGAAITKAFAAAGAHVIINCYRTPEAAQATLDNLPPGSGELMPANIADHRSVIDMFAEVTRCHGRLDALVNNAAVGTIGPLAGLRDKDLRRSLDTNIGGTLWCSQSARPLLAATGHGAIVNLTSVGSQRALAGYIGIGPSKAAVESLTRYLAVEYAAEGIRVNAVCGGLIDGEVKDRFFAGGQTALAAATPLRRTGTPAELAEVVMFLTSSASRWITGETIVVDGGLSIRYPGIGTTATGGPT